MVESSYCMGAFAPVDDKKIADVDLYVRGIFFKEAFVCSMVENAKINSNNSKEKTRARDTVQEKDRSGICEVLLFSVSMI